MFRNVLVRIVVALAILAGSQSGLQAQNVPTAEALAAGVSDRVWSLDEVVELLEVTEKKAA